jgi:hypothetical protein
MPSIGKRIRKIKSRNYKDKRNKSKWENLAQFTRRTAPFARIDSSQRARRVLNRYKFNCTLSWWKTVWCVYIISKRARDMCREREKKNPFVFIFSLHGTNSISLKKKKNPTNVRQSLKWSVKFRTYLKKRGRHSDFIWWRRRQRRWKLTRFSSFDQDQQNDSCQLRPAL